MSLLSGEDFWSLPAIPRLGLGKLRVTDGPNGARGGGSLIGGVSSACFPVGIALGATWDPELVERDRPRAGRGGQVQGRPRAAGADRQHPPLRYQRPQLRVLLRRPVAGRRMAVAYIRGAAVARASPRRSSTSSATRASSSATPSARRSTSVRCARSTCCRSRRRSRKPARWAVMTSYNRVNGTSTRRAPRAPHRGAARRMGLRRAGDVRLVRRAHDRAAGDRRSRPRDARPAARPWRQAAWPRSRRARSAPRRCAPRPPRAAADASASARFADPVIAASAPTTCPSTAR